jgi:NitT/TauT family transport system substrate-binding protein
MNVEGVQTMWKDVDLGMTLDDKLLSLLVSEGQWIVSKGVIKAKAPTPETMRPYLVDAPLKAVEPNAVKLP